jgi:diguanylate cyclase (GGDEF)-like protein
MALALIVGVQTVVGFGQLPSSPAVWVRGVAFVVEGTTVLVLFRLLQRRSTHLSSALTDLHAQRRLVERMAMEDSLTGLRNHRALRGDIASHVEFAAREGLTLTVVCADVDGLKATNDTYGHHRGDELLSGMARLLVENCRASDTAYRIGGDEFVVLLPGTGPAGYEKWKDRFEVLSAAMRDEFDGAGLSLGAAHLPVDAGSPDALLSIADKRMYAAKIANAHPRVVGRGRTLPAPSVTPPPVRPVTQSVLRPETYAEWELALPHMQMVGSTSQADRIIEALTERVSA